MTDKVKKYIRRALEITLFILLFCVMFICITYGFRDPLANSRDNIVGFYAEDKNSLDVVVLGTSSTFSAYNPLEAYNQYGYTSYDLCTNIMLQNSMPYYVREMYKTQNPKLVVVDVAPFLYGHTANDFRGGAWRYNIDAMKISKNRFDLINAVIPKEEPKLTYYFDLLYYHTNRKLDYEYMFWNRRDISKGYNGLNLDVAYDSFEDYYPAEEALSEESLLYLNQLIEELKKHDCKILFITDPIGDGFQKYGFLAKAAYIERIVTAQGCDFLNMSYHNDEIGLDPHMDFSLDEMHYHLYSADKITAFLGKYISENYELPDHRNQGDYAGWDTAYNEWLEERVIQENFMKWAFGYCFSSKNTPDFMNQILIRMKSAYLKCAMYAPDDSPYYETAMNYDSDESLLLRLKEVGNDIDTDGNPIILKTIVCDAVTGDFYDCALFTEKNIYHFNEEGALIVDDDNE